MSGHFYLIRCYSCQGAIYACWRGTEETFLIVTHYQKKRFAVAKNVLLLSNEVL